MEKASAAACKRRIQTLEKQLTKIKGELAELGDLRPGSLSEQYNVCGTPNCQCKADPPKKHGPYYQLSYTRKGKSTTRFVRAKDLATVKQQMKNYKRLRTLIDCWIDLAIELAALKMEDDAE